MQFLVLTRRRTDAFPPAAWTPELIAAEGQRVRELYASGYLRAIWRRKDTPGAAMLVEAASEDEVKANAASFPLAQRGMIEIIVMTQLDPYPAFGPQ